MTKEITGTATLDDFVNYEKAEEPKVEFTPPPKKLSRADKKAEKLFVNQALYMIRNPLIVWPGYEDDVTEEMRSKAMINKFANINEIFENQECETMQVNIYLSQASLVQPLTPTFAKMYFYCFSLHYDIAQIFPDPVDRDYHLRLEENERWDFKRLRQWLFKKQVSMLT
jgi:hypothetical protein